MIFMQVIAILLLFSSFSVSCVRNRDVTALSDVDYDLMIRKILGSFDTPVAERTKKEAAVIRKYYRWIDVGHEVTVGRSGRTIYVNGKQLLRKKRKNGQ